jgi:hypothetical protein
MKNYQAGNQAGKNPKSEYRNSKQTQNPQSQNAKSETSPLEFSAFSHLNLFRISDFELRIYFNLACFAPLRHCSGHALRE